MLGSSIEKQGMTTIGLTPTPRHVPSANQPEPQLPDVPRGYDNPVVRQYIDRGAARAGIDVADWNTDAGYQPIADTIDKVYRYYADTFERSPTLHWAGMAGLLAPTFVAAFQDLDALSNATELVEKTAARVPLKLGTPVERIAQEAGNRVDFMRGTLLSMQKQIFHDASAMFEAYAAKGIDGIRELRTAGYLDDHAVRAWTLIDAGTTVDPDRPHTPERRTRLLERGARGLVAREQMQVIGNEYDDLRESDRSIPHAMNVISTMGSLSMPGARAPRQAKPVRIGPLTLPITKMDISDRRSRWEFARDETAQAFSNLLRTDPATVNELLNTPIDDRIKREGRRMVP
jgi:hypothetical protein